MRVEPVVTTSMVVETVETQREQAKQRDSIGALAETLDGALHPILSVDFTDREMSDAEIVPELARLPADRTLVLLLNGNDMLREGADEINRLLLAGRHIQRHVCGRRENERDLTRTLAASNCSGICWEAREPPPSSRALRRPNFSSLSTSLGTSLRRKAQ